MNQTRLNNEQTAEKAEYRLTREERETLYRVDDLDNTCYVDSTIPKDIHRLERQGWIETGVQYYNDGTVMAKQFKAPRSLLSPRSYQQNKPKSDKPRRVMTDEQKRKMAEGRKAKKALKEK